MPRDAPDRVMRVVLTRELIVHTAVELVERAGPDALSMRAVGAELGVSAMAAYRHVPSRDALVEGVAEYVMGAIDLPDDECEDWREDARRLLRAFRAAAAEYPRSLALVLEGRISIPVRLRTVERAFAVCARAGLEGPEAVRAVHAFMAYALGSQLRESGMRRALRSLDHTEALRLLDPGRFPHVAALPGELLTEDSDADFEFGMELLLSAIERRLKA
ncbi:TetR/AcrR family transcriptional regulator [Actinomadura parmotrematis]|uniref:TetR/AcrR family transcriptional regulator n=1 Tax=Actinomadura parmotrematis TaxID=2864039 RepID=A0ABS7FMW7_9ACTN|nr:TetR/AcrR family transcriptional regulator [Actinomadura parmotrematis]MBW8481335.1 TetR/AcrR family transcriptional regulator [Actinomadura parmotrematis]